LHRGRFDLTLTSDLVDSLRREPPILIWIDCDLYTSARVVLERLLPVLRSGCVLYFDELNNMNFGSRLTGEARLVHEINAGLLGEDIELVHDPELSLSSRRLYRFIRLSPGLSFLREKDNNPNFTRMPKNGSPLP
ncbi:MAG TPA: hypothetical protein VMG11_08580, partial [Steroidobacteraceae bacterium]|nr:hypothetical protein [Steroidobacteraceae bacterium]